MKQLSLPGSLRMISWTEGILCFSILMDTSSHSPSVPCVSQNSIAKLLSVQKNLIEDVCIEHYIMEGLLIEARDSNCANPDQLLDSSSHRIFSVTNTQTALEEGSAKNLWWPPVCSKLQTWDCIGKAHTTQACGSAEVINQNGLNGGLSFHISNGGWMIALVMHSQVLAFQGIFKKTWSNNILAQIATPCMRGGGVTCREGEKLIITTTNGGVEIPTKGR